MKIDVTHLVGIPYRSGGRDPREGGVDCLWASRMALELIFEDLDGHELPVSADEEEVALAMFRHAQSRWKQVGSSAAAARKLGDLIYGQRQGHAYVAVLVDQIGLVALTALKDHGVCRLPIRRLEGVTAVFRRGAA